MTQQLNNIPPPGQIKACLFNLIVYAREGKGAAYLKDLEKSILEKFPCRIIFIQQTDDPKALELTMNKDVGMNRKFNCDELLIRTGSEMLSKVPYMVIPNIVPDLPIYLLWGFDPTTEKEILPHLEKYASKIIFDSEFSANLQTFAKDMLAFMNKHDTEVMDLNWASISGWRDALASVFDNEELINYLKTAGNIQITYNKQESEYESTHETKAIYLQSWLASRLDWKFLSSKREGNNRITLYKNTTGETAFSLIPEKKEGSQAGAIINLEVSQSSCEFQLICPQSQSRVVVHTTRNDRCELPYTIAVPDIKHTGTFMREIFFQAVNGHYRGMLNMIAQSQWE